MINIFASMLGKTDAEYGNLLSQTFDMYPDLYTKQEKEILRELSEDYKVTGQYSDPQAFRRQHPEMSSALDHAKVIDLSEVKHYLLSLSEKRTRQQVSQKLMVIANEVLDEGLTYEHLETIHGLPVREDLEVQEEEPLSFAERYAKRKTSSLGIQTGIKEIDDLIGGIPGGFILTLMAWTGSYKSTEAINMFYRNTVKNGYGQVYISLEMPKEDVYYNLICLHSNDPKFSRFPYIYHDRIRKGLLTPEEEDFILNEVEPDLAQFRDKMVILDETDFAKFNFGEIRAVLEKVDDVMPGGVDVVYWDHANLFKFSEGSQRNLSMGEVINQYVSFIRRLGIRFRRDKENPTQWRKLANVILAQCNRTGWQRAVKNNGRYTLTAISEANELERASSFVVSLFTSEDMKISREATSQLLKSRYGQTIYEPINIYADPERYLIGEEPGEINDSVSASMFDQMMGIDPGDMGFSSTDVDLSEFEDL